MPACPQQSGSHPKHLSLFASQPVPCLLLLAHAVPCWLLLCRLYDDRFVLRALWEDWRNTRYVAPDEPGSGVLWFRK